MWRDGFSRRPSLPPLQIYGIDICDQIKIPELRNDPNIHLFFTDAYNRNFVKNTFQSKHLTFDLIIDDGRHTIESMITCLQLYSPLLHSNGLLIIEDIPSLDWIGILTQKTPSQLRPHIEVYDLRKCRNRFDDILFVIDKDKSPLLYPNITPNAVHSKDLMATYTVL